MEKEAGVVLSPAVLRLYQGNRGFVAVFSLSTDQPQWLVDQHGDLVSLLALSLLVDLNAHIRRDLHAHLSHLAVDLDPALSNPFVRLAARGQAQLGHPLVQAQSAVGPDGRRVPLAVGQGGAARRGCGAAENGRGVVVGHVLFILKRLAHIATSRIVYFIQINPRGFNVSWHGIQRGQPTVDHANLVFQVRGRLIVCVKWSRPLKRITSGRRATLNPFIFENKSHRQLDHK